MSGLVRKKPFWGALFLGVALCGALWAYYQARLAKDEADPASARRAGRPIPVRAERVTLQKVEEVVGGTATTLASETAVLQVSAGGASGQSGLVVKAVPVAEGAYVKRGMVLIELEDELFRAAVKQREAEVTAATADLERARAQVVQKKELYRQSVAYAEAEVAHAREAAAGSARVRKLTLALAEAEAKFRKGDVETRRKHREDAAILYNKEKTAQAATYYFEAHSKHEKSAAELAKAERDLQQARNDMTTGPLADREAVAKAAKALQQAKLDEAVGPLADREALAKAESSLEAARGHLAVARKELEECKVSAPLDGLVDSLSLVAGQRVKQFTPLAHVLKVDPIFVKMDFPQERLGEVSPGQQADVVLDSFPGETFAGKVVRILPKVDTHLRVLPVYIQVDNARRRLRPGVTGFARIRTVKPALVVPAAAVLSQGNRSVVFRVEGGRARIREVRTGPTVRTGMLEVCSGLRAGDEVVIYSNFYADAGNLSRDGGFLQDNDPVDVNWRRWARRDD
jgi:RND family efflux transporter MFP subunit